MSDDEISENEAKKQRVREMRAVGAAPGYYSDSWWITRWKGHARITFGESIGGQTTYRFGVILEFRDLIALRDALSRSIERLEKMEENEGE